MIRCGIVFREIAKSMFHLKLKQTVLLGFLSTMSAVKSSAGNHDYDRPDEFYKVFVLDVVKYPQDFDLYD